MKTWNFIKELASAWSTDKLTRLSAALAYYTIFSLSPLLLISIGLAGLIFGADAAQGKIINNIRNLVGYETAQQIQSMISEASKPVSAIMAQISGFIILIFGASGVFSELQAGLNEIWEVKHQPSSGLLDLVIKRFLSFAMVLVAAFLLLVSLILSMITTSLGSYITEYLGLDAITVIVSEIFSFLITVLLFALMFKILPDKKINWHEVWLGAAITAILFYLGKFILSTYLSQANIVTSFGAAGSLVILLIWVYYTAQIFFIGAEITKLISKKSRAKKK